MSIRKIILCLMLITGTAQAGAPRVVDVQPGSLVDALEALAKQCGVYVMYPGDQLAGFKTAGVKGTLHAAEAFRKLIEGTPLVMKEEGGGIVISLRPAATVSAHPGDLKSALRLAQGEAVSEQHGAGSTSERAMEQKQAQERGVPEILVRGNKLLNMDIQRTREDAQPYVIFDRETIARSGANNLEAFLKQRLPMNASSQSTSQVATFIAGNTSTVNLRGLGANQTLILIDGHRMASTLVGVSSAPQQSDINGIPLAAIERIEVLPTTASGIYGGSATGGVVNIIMRRDYTGMEMKVRYENTFDTDASIRAIDLASGFSFGGGKTHVLLAGSYSDQNQLLVGDRNMMQRARDTILQNLGGVYYNLGNGAPLTGATANIRSVNGGPLFGPGTANVTFVSPGYAGGGGLAPLQANAGKFNTQLARTAQPSGNGSGSGAKQSYGSAPTIESLSATLRHEFTASVEAFLEVAAANNTSTSLTNSTGSNGFTINATAPNNPFGQAIQVGIPLTATDGVTTIASYDRHTVGGVLFKLPKQWRGEVDYTWSRSRYTATQSGGTQPTLAAAIANGVVDVLRDPTFVDLSGYVAPDIYTAPYYSTMRNTALRVSGPIGSLPAGPVTVSGLIEYRDENIGDGYQIGGTFANFYPSRWQHLTGAYVESKMPLVSAQNARAWVKELDLQVAGRLDDYALTGSNSLNNQTSAIPLTGPIVRVKVEQDSFNPTFGVRFRPLQDWLLRASYGTGFLPPTVNQLAAAVPVIQPVSGTSRDPRRGSTALVPGFTITTGGNSGLTPEESTSWSAGVIWTPRFAPALRLSVDYTRIEKQDNIVTLTTQQVIDNEAFLPGRVTRGANLPGDQAGWAGPIVAIDQTSVNLSSALLEAWDFALDYSLDTAGWGTFDLFAVATYQPHFVTRVAPTANEVENAGVGGLTSATPLKFKGNAGLTWRHAQWTAGWVSRYFDSYLVVSPTLSNSAAVFQRQGSDTVASQIYHDAYVGYEFGALAPRALGWLRGVELQLGVKNVFNKEPPLDVNNTLNLFSGFGDARLASYYLTARRSIN